MAQYAQDQREITASSWTTMAKALFTATESFAQLQVSEPSSQCADFDRSANRFSAAGDEFRGANAIGGMVRIIAGTRHHRSKFGEKSGSSCTISARVRQVRQEAAGEVPTMTAPWVVGIYAAGSVPLAGTGTEAWMRSSV